VLWGPTLENIDRKTGDWKDPEQKFEFISQYCKPKKGIESVTAQIIALTIAENELDVISIRRKIQNK